jgi:hypothetical protein
MKDSVAYKTLDNITVVLLAFGNLKNTLANEFESDSHSNIEIEKDSGQVGGSNEDQ